MSRFPYCIPLVPWIIFYINKQEKLKWEKCKAFLCWRTKIFQLACSISSKKNCHCISDAGVEISCTEVKCISTDSEGFLHMPEASDWSNSLKVRKFLSNVHLSVKNKHLNTIGTFYVVVDGMIRSVVFSWYILCTSESQQSRWHCILNRLICLCTTHAEANQQLCFSISGVLSGPVRHMPFVFFSPAF